MEILYCFALLFICTTVSSDTNNYGWFWHVTDFHWDFTYFGRQLSCNDDVPNPGKYGDYWCDAPWNLVNSSVEAMKNLKSNVDFILWTGDNTLHTSDDNVNLDIHDAILGNITNLLFEKFPDVPVYATFGNHDYFPHNQFPPHGNELYNRTYERWKNWINDTSQMENFLKGAYYTVKTKYGTRIVGLNTNLYYTSDKLTGNLTDPADQFMWLENVLTAARRDNEKVIITAHIPPGVAAPSNILWFYPHHNTRLNEIFIRFADVIVGMHYGHEHSDNFRVYFKNGNPVISSFCAPSVTPWRYKIPGKTGEPHNPGVRLFKYDRTSGRHLEMMQYFMDLPSANQMMKPEWKVEYSATTGYDINDLTPQSMAGLLTRMSKANSVELENYLKWKFVSADISGSKPCDASCKISVLCSFDNFEIESFNKCVKDSISGASKAASHVLGIFLGILTVFTISSGPGCSKLG